MDVATGSLGQGICAAVGIALNARRIGSDYRTYVLLGDGESRRGLGVGGGRRRARTTSSTTSAAITDVNALGQSQADRRSGHDMDALARRWQRVRLARRSSSTATTWTRCSTPSTRRAATTDRPTMILARTIKGKGVSFVEG